MATQKPLAFHGISNGKYALKEDKTYETPKDMPYSKTWAMNTMIDAQEVHADNRLVLRIPSDQGYDGTYGTTGQDTEFETAAGMIAKLDKGLATIKQTTFKRFAVYYETLAEVEGMSFTIKVWALNVEFSKPNENNQTDTNSVTIGEYVYPVRIYGETVMDGDKSYRDENGNEMVALIIRSFPGEAGYETFGDTVPVPTKTA